LDSDGTMLASGSADRSVKIASASTRDELQSVSDHTAPVRTQNPTKNSPKVLISFKGPTPRRARARVTSPKSSNEKPVKFLNLKRGMDFSCPLCRFACAVRC
jgi:hypothetical protein